MLSDCQLFTLIAACNWLSPRITSLIHGAPVFLILSEYMGSWHSSFQTAASFATTGKLPPSGTVMHTVIQHKWHSVNWQCLLSKRNQLPWSVWKAFLIIFTLTFYKHSFQTQFLPKPWLSHYEIKQEKKKKYQRIKVHLC